MTIETQVRNTIKEKDLIKKGDKVLIGVSGGPDSTALFHLMVDLQKEYDIKLVAVHLDHMLRGKRSTADANFVRKVATRLHIPVIMEKSNVKTIASSNKMSIEETAREVRYNFYQRAAEKVGANKIAIGHTMDDQVETVLMRFIRGSGSLGLSGIPYKRGLGNAWVIRPLLDVKRKDIERYLRKHKIPSRIDASNLETFYLRNRLRHILMPLLEREFNPNIKENLKLLARNLGDEFNYLNTVAAHLSKRLITETKTKITINIGDLLRYHVALQRLIVRQIIYKLKGDLKRITYKHWQEIESVLHSQDKTTVDLPGGLKVTKKQKRLIFTKVGLTPKDITQFKKVARLNIPGMTNIPELGVNVGAEIVRHVPEFKKGKKRKKVEYINGDCVTPPLKIRTWRRGDRIRPLGMKSPKKLHDIFVDEKISREIRTRIPLIISRNRILWVAGVKLSEDCKISKNTKKVIKLTFNPNTKK